MRPDVPLTAEQRLTLQRLQDYDLSPVRERLMRDGQVPSHLVDEAMLEFRRYVGLHYLVPCPRLMFSDHVDHVWHTFLLFSRLYADFCQLVLGHFFHHDPIMGPDPDRASKLAEFRGAYEQLFGPVGHLWHRGVGCG
jgi:hypothetical protein